MIGGLAQRFPSVARLALAAMAALASAAADEPPPRTLANTVKGLRGSLEAVAEADRAADAARGGLSLALRKAKTRYDAANRLRRDPIDPRKPNDEQVVDQAARGMAALLQGLEETDRHLELALESLAAALEQQSKLDRDLADMLRSSTEELRKLRQGMDEQRRIVARRWEHYKNPRLGQSREARNDARALVGAQLSRASADWQEFLVGQAKVSFMADRRHRLRRAGLLLKRRSKALADRREELKAFREFLLDPLGSPLPEKPVERLDWPSALRREINVLAEDFDPPEPYRLPDHWGLEDRVKRFTQGGGP